MKCQICEALQPPSHAGPRCFCCDTIFCTCGTVERNGRVYLSAPSFNCPQHGESPSTEPPPPTAATTTAANSLSPGTPDKSPRHLFSRDETAPNSENSTPCSSSSFGPSILNRE